MSNRTLGLMMGFVVLLIVAVGVIFVVAVAGGGGDDDDDGGNVPASNDGSGGGDTGNGGGGNDGATVSGICGENRLITFGSDPNTVLDPIQARDDVTSQYIVEIFGGLVTLDLDLNVVPDIAERWEISADGLTYTFFLREDVVFHNGRRVTADDFKYSFERAADPAEFSPTVLLYLDEIVGVRAKFNGDTTEVSGVEVIDEYTLQIRLNRPIGYFLQELTYPVAFVVDREQIESNPRDWTRKPVGTGPFRLKTLNPLEEIVLIRNDRYHLGVPSLEEVVFELGGGSLVTRFENDEIHIGGVPSIELAAVRSGDSPLSDEYRPALQLALGYIAMNLNKAPFDDPLVRQALALSIDRNAVNEVLLFDAWRVADGILPPEMPGYDAEAVTSYPYDPARAVELLSQSTYAGNVPRIVLSYGGGGGDPPDILQAFQQQWQDNLGIEIELQAVETAAYLRELDRGTFQMVSAGWIADYPDPEDFVGKLFESTSTLNRIGYANAEVDALIRRAAVERDQELRFRLYREAEQFVIDDAAIIPTFWPVDHLLVRNCVKNWPDLGTVVPKFRYIEIDPSKD